MTTSLKDLIEATTSYKLPDISDTNKLTSNDGNLVDETNKQIEATAKAEKEEASLFANSLKDVYESKKQRYNKFVNLIPQAYGLKKWIDDENTANAIFEEHEKLREEIETNSKFFPKGKEWEFKLQEHDYDWDISDPTSPLLNFEYPEDIEYNDAFKLNQEVRAELNTELDLWGKGESTLSPQELYLLTSETPTGKEIDNKAVFFSGTNRQLAGNYQQVMDYVFDKNDVYYLNAQGEQVFMPRDMSYAEALNSTDQSDNFWVPYLEKAMWSQYYAHLNKDNNLGSLSNREIKNKIFKPWLAEVDKNRETIVNSLLDDRLKNVKKRKALDLLDGLRSEDPVLGGVNAALNWVSTNELLADGTRDNQRGWNSLLDQLKYLADEEEVTSGELFSLLTTPFSQRGTNKQTTIGPSSFSDTGLKPEIAAKISKLATDLKLKENQQREALESMAIDDRYAEVTQSILESMSTDEPMDDTAIETLIGNEVNALSKEYGLEPSSQKFNKFKALLNRTGLADAYDAHDDLTKLLAANVPLDYKLINRIPKEVSLFGGNETTRAYWERIALRQGAIGLSPSEVKDVEQQIFNASKDVPIFKYDASKNPDGSIQQQNAVANATTVFYNKFNELSFQYRDQLRTGNAQEVSDLEATIRHASFLAAIESFNVPDLQRANVKPLPKVTAIGTSLKDVEIEQNTIAETFDQLNGSYEEIVGLPEYWSPGEELAIQSYLQYKANPKQGRRWASYYYYTTKNGRKFPNKPINEVIEARIAATAHLRKDDAPPVEDPTLKNLTQSEIVDLCTFPSAAKTAQKLCSAPHHAAWMLEALVDPDADDGINTVRIPGKGNASDGYEKLPNGKTLQTNTLAEVLQYAVLNPSAMFGKYGLTLDAITDQITAQGATINGDMLFDEALQQQLMLGRILQRANKDSQYGSFNQQFRRVNYLRPELQQQFYQIVNTEGRSESAAKFFNSPYNQIHTLSSEAAKVLADMSLELN